jgi:hypothetical protein
MAASVIDKVLQSSQSRRSDASPRKNPAAVSLGRLGGKKGGVARAKALSRERRSEIARLAAQTRWSHQPDASKD